MTLVESTLKTRTSRAFNIIQLLAVLGVLLLAAIVMIPVLTRYGHTDTHVAQNGSQVRNVIQAMTIFAQDNRDRYPLPSICDANNDTVPELGRAKDTTANILSILIFNNSISPELLYCPDEVDGRIKIHTGYQNSKPQAAVHPEKAVWDPSLRADFTTGDGHISYAQLMPDGDPGASLDKSTGRLKHWATTFNATEAIFGNRGPLVTGRDAEGHISFDKQSQTLLIYGGRTTWEGNIGYNDNHINFETRMDPTEITYQIAGGKNTPDIFFYDEPDDADGLNAYLGIWVKSGILPSEFKGIHD